MKKIAALIAFFLCLLSCSVHGIRADVYDDIAEVYDVSFRDSNGKNTQKLFSKYDTWVCFSPYDSHVSDNVITLPKVPHIKGFQSVGWTTIKNGKKPYYKPGDKVEITHHTRFYLVKQKSKTFTVKFLTKAGKSTGDYKRLTKKVEENTVLKLPELPGSMSNSKLYKFAGWSLKKNQSRARYSPKSKILVRRNITFYASWSKRK